MIAALPQNAGQHNWLEYDEDHRGCPRCGLRVFKSKQGRGWVLVNYYGQPTSNLLADVSGGFGSCSPPPSSGLVVLIDYTGDPDIHPGCERFMHRIQDAQLPRDPRADGGAAIVQLGSVLPVCGYRPQFWELGPPRKHIGWTFCLDCFPNEKGGARHSDRKSKPAQLPQGFGDLPRRGPPELPAGWRALPEPSELRHDPAVQRKRRVKHVVHLIDDVASRAAGVSQSMCYRRGVEMVSFITFDCLPNHANGSDPRRCKECLKRELQRRSNL